MEASTALRDMVNGFKDCGMPVSGETEKQKKKTSGKKRIIDDRRADKAPAFFLTAAFALCSPFRGAKEGLGERWRFLWREERRGI